MDQPDDLLQAVAQTMAGEDGCCCLWNIDGRCCMTDRAQAVFEVIGKRTGLTLKWFQAAEAYVQHGIADPNVVTQ